jgi:hypothetical protein
VIPVEPLAHECQDFFFGQCLEINVDRSGNFLGSIGVRSLQILREVQHGIGLTFAVSDEDDLVGRSNGVRNGVVKLGTVVVGVVAPVVLCLAHMMVMSLLARRHDPQGLRAALHTGQPHSSLVSRYGNDHESMDRLTHSEPPVSMQLTRRVVSFVIAHGTSNGRPTLVVASLSER